MNPMNLDFDAELEAAVELQAAQELGDAQLIADRQAVLDAIRAAMKVPTIANVQAIQIAKAKADQLDDALEALGKAKRLHPSTSMHIKLAQARVDSLKTPPKRKRSTKQP